MHRSFLFVNPCGISAINDEDDVFKKGEFLARRLEDAKPGQLVFAPCNIG